MEARKAYKGAKPPVSKGDLRKNIADLNASDGLILRIQ